MASSTHTASSASPSVTRFAESVLSLRNDFATDALWARHHARAYFHDVSNTPGFLPVYHILLKTASSGAVKTALDKSVKNNANSNTTPVSKSQTSDNSKTTRVTRSSSAPTLTFEKDFNRLATEELKNLPNFDSVSDWARVTARKMYHSFDAKTPFVDLYNWLMRKAIDDYTPTKKTTKSTNTTDTKSIINKTLYGEFETWYDAFEEEAREDPEGPSVKERWTQHCSKILARRLHTTREAASTIIQKWLAKH